MRGKVAGPTTSRPSAPGSSPTCACNAEARPAAEHWEIVREDGGEALRYLKPVVTSAMCLTCHGEKAKIPPAVQAILARDYPDDHATGFSVGDVRGAVSVRIPLLSPR